MTIQDQERSKYKDAWALSGYRQFSPGESFVDLFMSMTNAKPGDSVVDFGAGAGAASRKLKDRGLSVTSVDLVDADWQHSDIPLLTGCLWRTLPLAGVHRFGYCCDVMEHLPKQFTALALSNMLSKCSKLFLSISFTDDFFGHMVGEPLHLTVEPFVWWRDTLTEVGTLIEARDLLGEGVFLLTRGVPHD